MINIQRLVGSTKVIDFLLRERSTLGCVTYHIHLLNYHYKLTSNDNAYLLRIVNDHYFLPERHQYDAWRDQFVRQGEPFFSNKESDKSESRMKKKMTVMEQVIGKLTLELKKTRSL